MAAFKASRSVCRAISWTILIRSAIVRIASTLFVTASPLRSALPEDLRGDLFRLGGVLGVLLDVGRHLLHRRGGLLGRRRLLRRTLAQLLGCGRALLAAARHVLDGCRGVADNLAELDDHPL